MVSQRLSYAIAVVGCFVSAPSFAQSADPSARNTLASVRSLDAKGVVDLINAERTVIILDNRSSDDFDRGRIEGALKVMESDLKSRQLFGFFARNLHESILIVCENAACDRARNAADLVVGWGYTRVYTYPEGMDDWNKRRLPVVTR